MVVGGSVVVLLPKEVGVAVPGFAEVVDGPLARMVVAVELFELEMVVAVELFELEMVVVVDVGVVDVGVVDVRDEVNEADE